MPISNLIPSIFEVRKAKSHLWAEKRSASDCHSSGSRVQPTLVRAPSCPKDTSFNSSMASILTSIISFKDLYWSVTKAFLLFSHDDEQCLEVP